MPTSDWWSGIIVNFSGDCGLHTFIGKKCKPYKTDGITGGPPEDSIILHSEWDITSGTNLNKWARQIAIGDLVTI